MQSNTAQSFTLRISSKPRLVGKVQLSSQVSKLTPTWSHHRASPPGQRAQRLEMELGREFAGDRQEGTGMPKSEEGGSLTVG